MYEHIVDCEHVPYGDGKALVLPISVNGHVHERIIRCAECRYCSTEYLPYYCRAWHNWVNADTGYCHRAKPRDGDG